jgi:tripartite ATP-independent transporter DctM subunit
MPARSRPASRSPRCTCCIAPALPPAARTLAPAQLARRVVFVLLPPLALIFLVLGTIFLGVATPTEGGAMGATGALLMAIARGRLTFKLLGQALDSTARISAFVMFILIGARVFSLVFQGVGGKEWIEHLLTSLPGGVVGFLIFVNIFVFIIAFFLDFFEIAFIIIPLLAPAAEKLGIDLIWFGILIGANVQTSFMHPPFGFALFYIRGIAPRTVKSSDIYIGAIPWVVLQLILVALLIAFPKTVTFLLDKPAKVDPAMIEQQLRNLPGFDLPPPTLDLGPPRL